MKKSFTRCVIFHETSTPAKPTSPFSSTIGAAIPSTARCSEIPFSPRKAMFSIHGY